MIKTKFSVAAIATILFGVTMIVLAIATPQSAFAAVGSGGTGGGGGGPGPYTKYGFGWYRFSVGGPGPRDFQNGGNWAGVSNACHGYKYVMAFIVQRSSGGPTNARVYDDTWNWGWTNYEGWTGYLGNAGGNWVPRTTAWNMFWSLPASERSGYTIGTNVGWFCYEVASNFTTTGTTTIDRTTAYPNDVVRWTHTLRNNGPTASTPIRSQTANTGFSNASFNGVKNVTTAAMGPGATRSHVSYATYTVTQADVGNSLCQQLQWDPTSSAGGRHGRATNRCVTIPYSYTLTPEILSPVVSTTVESDGRPIPVRGRVSNDGSRTKSQPNIQWQISQIKYNPGVTTIPNQSGGTGATPCSYFTGGACTRLDGGTQASGYGVGTVTPGNPASSQTYLTQGQLENEPAGTKICFAMSVQPYTHSSSHWRHSRLHCLIIGKQPKVQVWGGSIQTGRTFEGTLNSSAGAVGSIVTKSAGITFGSWAEYGIFAPSSINLIASGSGLNVPTGHPSSLQNSWSAYTFTQSGSSYGNYAYGNASIPDVTTIFPSSSATVTGVPSGAGIDVVTIPKGANIRPNTGTRNITVSASANPALTSSPSGGQWSVINAVGHNVTITTNLEYANGPFTRADQVPQLVIIADNITIAAGVTRVDAWLVAKNDRSRLGAYGAIATCDQQSGSSGANGLAQWLATPNGSGTNYTESNNVRLTIDHCNQQLRINGPVIANKLYLRRTAGSGPNADAGTPAEIINLRPDAYLWAQEHMSTGTVYQVTSEKELPPRY